MRPEYIEALFPHYVIKRPGYTEAHPEALTELRLNHFKWCDTLGEGCFGTNQSNMDVGRKTFHKKLQTDETDWKTRCSDMLAIGAAVRSYYHSSLALVLVRFFLID